jgi:hypothetical protein
MQAQFGSAMIREWKRTGVLSLQVPSLLMICFDRKVGPFYNSLYPFVLLQNERQ